MAAARRAPSDCQRGGEGGRGQGERATEPGLGAGGREGGRGARGGGSPPSPAAAAAAAGGGGHGGGGDAADLGPARVPAPDRPRPGAPSAPGALAGGAPAVRPRPAGQCGQAGRATGPREWS